MAKLILVTNDDGIAAPGIRALVEAAMPLGDVLVVAPDKPQSGMGHAITISSMLRVNRVHLTPGAEEYSTTGTPVDCIKLALKKIATRRPDLIVSGINHGYNSSINVIYSGTMSAAIEGAMDNIPSIGFSLGDYSVEADFSASLVIARKIIAEALKTPFPDNVCLNVNIPPVALKEINGIRVCRQARGIWDEKFDERIDPYGKSYYWLTGSMTLNDEGEDTDEYALSRQYVSVVPIQFDMTAHHALESFKGWNEEKTG